MLAGAAAITSVLRGQTSTPPTSDLSVLNYALTLENLEATFYTQVLQHFTSSDFNNLQLGLGNTTGQFGQQFGDTSDTDLYGMLVQIRDHEQAHVRALTRLITQLGGKPNLPCTYNFGYNTVGDVLKIAMTLENTGVSAYDGAANLISSPTLRQAAATIATVEGRHASYLNLVNGSSPFPNAFDPTLTMSQVLTAVAPFIGSCPSTNS